MPIIPLKEASGILDQLEPRVLFSDIDGTLVGRGGSLFAAMDGASTLDAARALIAAKEAGLRIVLMSGRPCTNVMTVARLLGLNDAITELGTMLVVDGETELIWGDVPRGLSDTPAETMEQTGALRWLLERYIGRLEPHEPLPQERRGTILLRGQIDIAEANIALAEVGFGWTQLIDNGRFNRVFPHLGSDRTHGIHLAPAGVNKGASAELYLKRRSMERYHAAAIGDAPSDLQLTDHVGAMFLVANGCWAVANDEVRSIIVSGGSAGSGWAEIVMALLSHHSNSG